MELLLPFLAVGSTLAAGTNEANRPQIINANMGKKKKARTRSEGEPVC